MTEQAALQAAIIADPDDDTARLVYADWLDENKPDRVPSPAAGPSARAEFIRVQCRLAAGAFADPSYPKLLERETDLADWLNTHDPDESLDLSGLYYNGEFDRGEWGSCRRGFPEVVEFDDYGDDATANVEEIAAALEDGFAKSPSRTLRLNNAMAEEIVLLTQQPVFEQLRGLWLDYLDDGSGDDAVSAIASSPYSVNLRRVYFDFPIGAAGWKALARSPYLGNVTSLVLDYPQVTVPAVKTLARAKWFRNLRHLHLYLGARPRPRLGAGDVLRAVSDLPVMPRLVSLTLRGSMVSHPAALRQFAASEAFPHLARLNLSDDLLSGDDVALLARGRWPLRHLKLARTEVRKAGAEALAGAAFAPTLRVLDLRGCEISAGGVQALAGSDALAGLRHLNLSENPVGPGGLEAIAASPHLRNLRVLNLAQTNTARGPIATRDVVAFLTALATHHIRHLQLDQLPVGVRGAKVLASSRAFANLTRLNLSGCGVGEAGTKAVVGSKTLANLVVLDLSDNKVGGGAAKLASRNVFSRLAHCRLGTGTPKATATRLRRRPGVRV